MKTAKCSHCGCETQKSVGHVNRSLKIGAPLYCNRTCAGLARRCGKTPEQQKEEKRIYDAQYRKDNAAVRKAKKADWYQRTYDPTLAAVERKVNMQRHVEYCRRPEYKQYKQKYDQQHRAKKLYGEFFEAYLLLMEIDKAVASEASKYEIGLANGTINKAQQRRRDYERTYSNEP